MRALLVFLITSPSPGTVPLKESDLEPRNTPQMTDCRSFGLAIWVSAMVGPNMAPKKDYTWLEKKGELVVFL